MLKIYIFLEKRFHKDRYVYIFEVKTDMLFSNLSLLFRIKTNETTNTK